MSDENGKTYPCRCGDPACTKEMNAEHKARYDQIAALLGAGIDAMNNDPALTAELTALVDSVGGTGSHQPHGFVVAVLALRVVNVDLAALLGETDEPTPPTPRTH
jgi:hypothetical protein